MKLSVFLDFLEGNGISYIKDEPMCNHTTFKTGGNADVFINVSGKKALIDVLSAAEKNSVPVFTVGKGSNLLVSDEGVEGAVVSLSSFDEVKVEGNNLICGSGANLAAVCIKARENSLSGLEFAYGIPGSVGGALYMNAGAYGGEMSQVVDSAEVMDFSGNITEISREEMCLGYRTSIFSKKNYIILSVKISLNSADKSTISKQMDDLLSRRKEKQPLSYPSAGSTFKRPEGYFAGTLIEKNGLKGKSIGGAAVSSLHAGFVINENHATTSDIIKLIRHVQETVYKNDGVLLKTEVLFVGRTPKNGILPYTNENQLM